MLHPNHKGFYADMEQAWEFVEKEVEFDYVKTHTFTPFFPLRVFPYLVQQVAAGE